MTLVLFKFAGAEAVVAAPLKAAPVKILWDASSDPSVRGYAVYYGVVNSAVTNRFDVGTNLSATLTNLSYGSSYFFYAVGYNSVGAESKASNTLLYAPPAMTRIKLWREPNGDMKIGFRVAAKSACRVQYVDKLGMTNWTQLGLATSDTNGNVTFTDPAIGWTRGRPNMRFYRGVVP